MSEPTGARRYGTGGGDAYYDAVKYGGYEGTREQFGKDQAEFAKNATAVSAAKEVVERDTEEVRSTKETFVNTTVPDAITAIQQEGTTQVQAVTQQGEESSQQVEAVGTQWKDEVANEGRARVQAVEQAGIDQVQGVNQAGADQVDAVEQAGAGQVQAVTDEGTTQITAVEDAGAAERTAIEEKGEQTRESIPDDYTALSDEVDNLNRQLSDVETATYTEIQNDIDWLIGTISGHGYPKTNSKRLVTGNFLNLGDVSVEDGGEIAIHAYSSTTAYLGGWANWAKSIKKSEILTTYPTAKYMRVVFMRTNNTDCSLSDIQTYGIRIYDEFASVETKNNNTKKSIIVPMPAELGGIKNTGLPQTDPESANYVR